MPLHIPGIKTAKTKITFISTAINAIMFTAFRTKTYNYLNCLADFMPSTMTCSFMANVNIATYDREDL